MPGVEWKVKRQDPGGWSARLHTRVATETETFAQNVLSDAQANVRVRSGTTQATGKVTGADLQWMVNFGGAALYLEFGTHKMPAYPFLGPAFYNQVAPYLARLAITTQGRIRTGGMSSSLTGVL